MISRLSTLALLLVTAAGCARHEARPSAKEDRPSLAVPSAVAPTTIAPSDPAAAPQAQGGPAASASEAAEDEPMRGGGPITTVGALELLSATRCERAATCGTIGKGGAFSSHKTCVRTSLQRHAEDLGLLQCSRGIDHHALSACVAKLRSVSCDRRGAAAAEICGAQRMCLKE